MKKLLMTLMILGLGAALAYASTGPMPQQVTIISGHTLTLTVPAIVSYALTAPLDAGDETAAPAATQTVTLSGNGFTNSDIQPFITVSMSGTVTNARMVLNGISLGATGTVTVGAPPAEMILGAVPQNYAMPNGAQPNTYGRITGSHNVIVRKGAGGVPANPVGYVLTLTWTGYDAAT